jgi:cobyrinic acid a,c-diamide synthase
MAKGIVVAGMGGGSGKSVVAVSLIAALVRQGLAVVPFKKGPDYIDAGWLQLVANRPCYNLDPYLMSRESIRQSFSRHSRAADRVIVEGNRGLYDGVNVEGAFSTAELSIILDLPVLLVVDCTKVTRTVAAMVLGCRELDPRIDIRGVVLNRLGSSRQEAIIRQAIEHAVGIPVVGALPRMTKDVFPQRHLGVTPHQEHANARQVGDTLAEMAAEYIDLAAVEGLMAECGNVTAEVAAPQAGQPSGIGQSERMRIGVLRDAAFQFYYPDNLEALVAEGGELVEIDALTAVELPELDGLYIGGGFPETSARQLAANEKFRASLRRAAGAGLPIYAECGGLIYLGESILLDGTEYPLAGVFPVRFGLARKPQAHGYTVLLVSGSNPFYPPGLEIKGHEFRYSTVIDWRGEVSSLAMTMKRGVGFIGGADGLVFNNVLALYTHIHAAATPEWAPALIAKAREYHRRHPSM